MKKIEVLILGIALTLLIAYGWLILGYLNILSQQSLNAKYSDTIFVKGEDAIFLNGQLTTIKDLEPKLRIPAEKTENFPTLIIISHPQLSMKYFSNLLTKICSAQRGNLFLQVGKKDSTIYSLPMPGEVDDVNPETGKNAYNALYFAKDIQGNLFEEGATVFYCLRIPVIPLAKSESCLFEGKPISNYSELIRLLKSNKLFQNKISLIFAWRKESTINDFIVFLREMKSSGVRFIEVKNSPESKPFDKYELKIEDTDSAPIYHSDK